MNKEIKELSKKSESYAKTLQKLQDEIHKVVVGQEDAVKKIILALLSGGHVLLEGVPGIAKTLMIKTLSATLDGSFVRLQFTPDLLPADIIGTKIYDHKKGTFSTSKGPLFVNFVLADEINRAPPKVQSALLEAMQEQQVSIQGETYKLPNPFMVLATQNPIESEGTYALPEAQVDRFMFKLLLSYPSKEDEKLIMERFTTGHDPKAKKTLSLKALTEMQSFVHKIYADDKIKTYVADIVDATRNAKQHGMENYLEYGASPRASLWLIMAAKAHALLDERGYVIPEDVKTVAPDVLRHRLITTYEAEAENITSDQLVATILNNIHVP